MARYKDTDSKTALIETMATLYGIGESTIWLRLKKDKAYLTKLSDPKSLEDQREKYKKKINELHKEYFDKMTAISDWITSRKKPEKKPRVKV
ncbi:MAG: hypothetical protein LBC87_10370 [Fibromonadaceae bacterium]|jgi:predicted DNA-binding transcriptional regulator AlpA|nr:hypothetical protein [Fibromonadaceae bacterium]